MKKNTCKHTSRLAFPVAILSSLMLLTACSEESTSPSASETIAAEVSDPTDTNNSTDEVFDDTEIYTEEFLDSNFTATDWSEESHSNDVDPDYDEVFDDTQVKRLDFVITPERWQSMLDDMTSLYGEFGGNSGNPGNSPNGVPIDGELADGIRPDGGIPPDGVLPDGEFPVDFPTDGAQGAQGEGRQPGGPQALLDPQTDSPTAQLSNDEDPIFVPAEVFYNNKQWYRVGLRFKGNSSLQSSWQAGILKLSFKMDFDEYEDEYPQIDNQRFYGFKKFSLKNNYNDKSGLREKVASEVFRAAGVPASQTSFYALYVDHGNGPEYFGLYTLVEEVDGSVLDTQFSSDEGNLYKPEDGSASFVEGTFDPENFEKKTNEDDEDWSDIEALFAALHDETADSDPALWRENLESTFDVDGYLKYLAVNGIIQNWDTYGRMIHNFYLYNNPETEQLTWIPWDNNESLQEGKQGGAVALDFSDLDATQWPLIAKIYADEVYRARYDLLLADVMSDAFETSSVQAGYDNYSAIVAPYATTELPGYSFLNSSDDFATAIDELKAHALGRATAVADYLNEQ